MKKVSLFLLSVYLVINSLTAQKAETYNQFLRYVELYNSGNFAGAEKCMLSVLNSGDKVPEVYITAAYNNLGLIRKNFGLYSEALDYYNLAENAVSNRQQNSVLLADIYVNKSRIHTFRKSYTTAIEYLEKAIRIYQNTANPDRNILQKTSITYLNTGIVYYELKDYSKALEYLEKSAILKINHNLSEIELTYLNLAKTYAQINNPLKTEEYFMKSIDSFIKGYGEDYYRMAELYFDYGRFMQSIGKNAEALEAHRKALSICLKSYGEKHTLVSFSYKNLGDNYLESGDFKTALYYYQKALISISRNFNNADIYTNPVIDSTIFDIRLLEILKGKARVLELFAGQETDYDTKLHIMHKSLETIELALRLIDRIRNDYLSEESRIYLAENEKETYIFAIHLANSLFTLNKESVTLEKMYDIATKGKAAILRREITGNKLVWSAGLPDSLYLRHNHLAGNIAAYNNLLLEEMRKTDPDSNRIALWKDALFDMNREKEALTDQINKEFPQYHELLEKTRPAPLNEIRRKLKRNETIIDYMLSGHDNIGYRKLYIFLIARDRLELRETSLDSTFIRNVDIIRKGDIPSVTAEGKKSSFKNYTDALWYMYDKLVRPIEELTGGIRLIIIPDEEIAWLPFDAFLKNKPESYQADYEGLNYLIYYYTFSYGYSSSLISGNDVKLRKGKEVYAFSPDYDTSDHQASETGYLRGTGEEIESVYKWFGGKKFTGEEATETNFRKAIFEPAIFHFAMHSLSDTVNSRYSCLLFDGRNDTTEDGKLYNYEISLSRIYSPMIVLSACNSGTGTLFHGEGLMSLARGFILAGASSVIKTAWEINDEASAAIITRFYHHLSKGEKKDEALRLAKLEYLDNCPPAYTNPYYWAAYEVLGDNAAVTRNNRITVIAAVILILSGGIWLVVYFRRRIIFSARSW